MGAGSSILNSLNNSYESNIIRVENDKDKEKSYFFIT